MCSVYCVMLADCGVCNYHQVLNTRQISHLIYPEKQKNDNFLNYQKHD